ncbi:hypothetical protein KAW38_04000 [Candidatus Micrarchaeota archaeon]|nr:hypothetical protein [Candidatus Micrarchaeota archaeon]
MARKQITKKAEAIIHVYTYGYLNEKLIEPHKKGKLDDVFILKEDFLRRATDGSFGVVTSSDWEGPVEFNSGGPILMYGTRPTKDNVIPYSEWKKYDILKLADLLVKGKVLAPDTTKIKWDWKTIPKKSTLLSINSCDPDFFFNKNNLDTNPYFSQEYVDKYLESEDMPPTPTFISKKPVKKEKQISLSEGQVLSLNKKQLNNFLKINPVYYGKRKENKGTSSYREWSKLSMQKIVEILHQGYTLLPKTYKPATPTRLSLEPGRPFKSKRAGKLMEKPSKKIPYKKEGFSDAAIVAMKKSEILEIAESKPVYVYPAPDYSLAETEKRIIPYKIAKELNEKDLHALLTTGYIIAPFPGIGKGLIPYSGAEYAFPKELKISSVAKRHLIEMQSGKRRRIYFVFKRKAKAERVREQIAHLFNSKTIKIFYSKKHGGYVLDAYAKGDVPRKARRKKAEKLELPSAEKKKAKMETEDQIIDIDEDRFNEILKKEKVMYKVEFEGFPTAQEHYDMTHNLGAVQAPLGILSVYLDRLSLSDAKKAMDSKDHSYFLSLYGGKRASYLKKVEGAGISDRIENTFEGTTWEDMTASLPLPLAKSIEVSAWYLADQVAKGDSKLRKKYFNFSWKAIVSQMVLETGPVDYEKDKVTTKPVLYIDNSLKFMRTKLFYNELPFSAAERLLVTTYKGKTYRWITVPTDNPNKVKIVAKLNITKDAKGHQNYELAELKGKNRVELKRHGKTEPPVYIVGEKGGSLYTIKGFDSLGLAQYTPKYTGELLAAKVLTRKVEKPKPPEVKKELRKTYYSLSLEFNPDYNYPRGTAIDEPLTIRANRTIAETTLSDKARVDYTLQVKDTDDNQYFLLTNHSSRKNLANEDVRCVASVEHATTMGGELYVYLKGGKIIDAREGRKDFVWEVPIAREVKKGAKGAFEHKGKYYVPGYDPIDIVMDNKLNRIEIGEARKMLEKYGDDLRFTSKTKEVITHFDLNGHFVEWDDAEERAGIERVKAGTALAVEKEGKIVYDVYLKTLKHKDIILGAINPVDIYRTTSKEDEKASELRIGAVHNAKKYDDEYTYSLYTKPFREEINLDVGTAMGLLDWTEDNLHVLKPAGYTNNEEKLKEMASHSLEAITARDKTTAVKAGKLFDAGKYLDVVQMYSNLRIRRGE